MKPNLVLRLTLLILVIGIGCVMVTGLNQLIHGMYSSRLVAAASRGNATDIKYFLNKGANPDATHHEGSSALYWAVCSGNQESVQALLDAGANPNSRGQYYSVIEQALFERDNSMGTPKYYTCAAIVKALVAKGAILPSWYKKSK